MMKTRQGFVSNSSSSSFIIGKSNLTNEQIGKILDHHKIVENHGCHKYDSWEITIEEDYIKGSTLMDNFDMGHYLSSIGVDPDVVEWSDY